MSVPDDGDRLADLEQRALELQRRLAGVTGGLRSDWGTLTNYDTGTPLRPATYAEWERGAERIRAWSATGDGGEYCGQWLYDGPDWVALSEDGGVPLVYVAGGPDVGLAS